MSRNIDTVAGGERDAPATGASARVVALLEAVAAAESSTGVRELARLTGIDKSAVSRLLAQLQKLGVVEQAQGLQGRYTVGPRLLMLGSMVAARDSLLVAARPIIRALVDEVDESCYLSTVEHDGYVFRDKVDCNKPIRYFLEMGRPMPLNAGAGGRAVLAGMGSEQASATVRRVPLERLTENTVVDVDQLLKLAEEDRSRGWSVSVGERLVGGSAIAAPYFVADGSCRGALVLAIPAERLDRELIPSLGEAVARAARELSARLGHGPSWQGADDGTVARP